MNFLRLGVGMIRDLIVRLLPQRKEVRGYKYAFIVHPRDISDVARKYSIFRFIPNSLTCLFTRFLWPVVLSEVTGLKSKKTQLPIQGWVITIPLTARQMIENRSLALTRIIQACKLAEKMGVNIVGLGALTSSFSRGGLDLIGKTKVGITTGHAYTAYTVFSNIMAIIERFRIPKERVVTAIVGALGSIGSTTVLLLARAGFRSFILIDLVKRKNLFHDLMKNINKISPNVEIVCGHKIGDIRNADFIVTATNAPETLVHAEDLKTGAIVFDDAQPSDIAEDVFLREDVIVLEAGIVKTPLISNNFHFGLLNREDNFCCLAEVLILASIERYGHYVINRANLELVDEIVQYSNGLNFQVAEFQNNGQAISNDTFNIVGKILEANPNVK